MYVIIAAIILAAAFIYGVRSPHVPLNLVPDWKRAWRWWSVIVGMIGAALTAVAAAIRDGYMEMPDGLRDMLPDKVKHWLPTALFVLGIVVRLIQQRKKPQGESP